MNLKTTTVKLLLRDPPKAGSKCNLVGRIVMTEIGFWLVDLSSAKPELSCAIGIEDSTLADRFKASGVPALGGGPFLYSFESEFGCVIRASTEKEFAVTVGQLANLKLYRRDRGKEYQVNDC